MDFFDRQDRARRRTRWLVLWFCLAVACIVVVVYLAVLVLFAGTGLGRGLSEAVVESPPGQGLWNPELFGVVAASILLVVGVASAYKMSSLRAGGEKVATMLGGRPIDPNTKDGAQKRLLNIVEEMAIAAGTSVPTVFLMERESGVNAFAAGTTSGDAVIGVTRGCLDQLSRDELQGVIAHEFSHILNGDMRLNLRLMGVLHGILVIALAGYWLVHSLRFGGRRQGGSMAAIAGLGLVLLVVGWIGVFFGRLIKSGVSRQREFLADSSAVQFTRNPAGLAEALKKIGGLGAGSRLLAPRAEEASHLFFANGLKKSFLGSFSTHPPLGKRIRLLDPRWDGAFPEVSSPVPPSAAGMPAATAAPAATSLLAGGAQAEYQVDVGGAASRVGTLEQEMIDHAQRVVASLPAAVAAGVHEPVEAEAIIYALLLHTDPGVREQQLARLEGAAGERGASLLGEVHRALRGLQGAGPAQRLPIVDLTLPALKLMSDRQYQTFATNTKTLASGEGSLRLFEFTLQRIISRHLAPHFEEPESSRVLYYSLRGLVPECSTLLSALAHVGLEDQDEVALAFAAGVGELDGKLQLELLPARRCQLTDVDEALRRLAQVAPRFKRQLVKAIIVCIAYDRKVTIEEAELLRAICDALDCPMPPFVGQETG